MNPVVLLRAGGRDENLFGGELLSDFPQGKKTRIYKGLYQMINKLRFGAAGAAIAAALGMASVANAADNADATATAEVLSALTLEVAAGTKLDFGSMVVSGAGTVALAADGTLTCTDPDVICSGTTSVPTFNISGGTINKAVTVTLPTGTVNLLRSGGAPANASDVIVLGSFVDDTTAGEVTLDGSGAGSFDVGGTITFDGSEVPGVYSGTFNVSVAYS